MSMAVSYENIFPGTSNRSNMYKRGCCYHWSSQEMHPNKRTEEERERFKKCIEAVSRWGNKSL
jgi:hypothetical protein